MEANDRMADTSWTRQQMPESLDLILIVLRCQGVGTPVGFNNVGVSEASVSVLIAR